ncbi:UNVERIFIED_CONTAM: Disease resistance protein RPP13 [Sesamum latifolium]|uniref:Disease resistance protein RPP13 n=1 Tax=Sesamum latifolium TaxID=2727402 RepID=A0AAW2WDZ9_9LAMI
MEVKKEIDLLTKPMKKIEKQLRYRLRKPEEYDEAIEKVFGEEHSCPPQLEEAGKKIARKCEGLPLAIIAIGKHLSKAEKTPEYWSKVAEKEILNIISADAEMSKALYLSYNRLPPSLQVCFVYMGVFPHDYEIPTSKLINLWCAEGFVQPEIHRCLEDSAMKDLEYLASSSVVLVCQESSYRKIKTCKLHSVFRHLCIKEAGKDMVFHILDSYANQGIESQRRLCILNNVLFGIKDVHKLMASRSNTRSLLCTGAHHPYPVPMGLDFRLLRVLDALTIRFYGFPTELVKLIQLRMLSYRTSQHFWVLALVVSPKRFSEESPNLKKLGTRIELPLDVAEPLCCFDHLIYLDHLKSFKCSIVNPSPRLQVLGHSRQCFTLPSSLRKLTLSGLGFPWEYMRYIANLPFLEVLKLRCYAFQGPEWKTFDGGFRSLTFLLIEDTDLEYWRVDRTYFRWLQRLFIPHCYKLKEIPLGIGETLRTVEIVDGSPSLVASAKRILEEQQSLGNDLQVCVKYSSEDDQKTKS